MKKLFSVLLCLFLLVLPFSALAEGLEIESEPDIFAEAGKREVTAEPVDDIVAESEITIGDAVAPRECDEYIGEFAVSGPEDEAAATTLVDPFPEALSASEIDYTPDDNGKINLPRPYAYNLQVSGSGTYLSFSFIFGAEFGTGPYMLSYKVYNGGELISSGGPIEIAGASYAASRTLSANSFIPGRYTVYVAVEDAAGNNVYTAMSKEVQWNSDGSREVLGDDSSAPLYPDFHVGGGTKLVGYIGSKSSVVIPTGLVSTIGTAAFDGCSQMISLIIPKGVTTIEDYAFGDSSMPEMFSDCDKLTDIYMADDVANIAPNALYIGMKTIFDDPVTVHVKCDSVSHRALKNNGYPKGFVRLDVTGHTEIVDEAVSPTCTEAGLSRGRHCSVCGEVIVAQEEVPATGHTVVIDDAVDPTCIETGKTEGSHCSVCGEVIVAQEVVPATGHTVVIDDAVDPTCIETGKTEGSHCSVCGEVIVAQEVVPATGHTEVIDDAVAARCTTVGKTKGSHCSVCNEVLVKQEDVPATGHTPEVMPAVEATTTSTGLTEGSKCSVCGTVLKAQEVIPVLTAEQPSVEPQPTEQTSTDPAVPTETAAPANPEPTAPPVVPVPGDYVDTTGKFIINADLTATYNGPAKAVSKVKTATIPDEISVGGISVKVTAIADKAFYKASKLTKVTIGANVKTIGKSAFASCAKLKTVSGGSGVVTIGASAFKGDKALTKITIGKKVTTIGKSAFNGCKKLKTVTIKSTKLKKVGSSAFKGVASSVTFKCPSKQLKAYKKLIKKAGAPKAAKIKK